MKQIIIASILLLFCLTTNAQKPTEPKHLGDWTYGGDPSEFLLHSVMEYSQALLQENPNGKLIVRICSSDDIKTAFVKTSINPLSASNYNQVYLIVPYEQIFIANYSGCVRKDKFVYNQYWFVPENGVFKYDEIVSVKNLEYVNEYIEEYVYESFEYNRIDYELLTKEFEKITEKFIDNLNANPNSVGFIVHNSKRKKLKKNLKKVIEVLNERGINPDRYKVIKRPTFESNKKGKAYLERNNKMDFPSFSIVEIKE